MKTKLISLCSLIITFGCVDRVFFDIKIPETYGVSISGFISDQLGPYQVTVLRTFDTESRENLRTGVSARVVLSDGEGNSETMTQVKSGIYETSVDGMKGKVGGVYKITVEVGDGRIYESIPDTLYASGSMDSIYYKFTNHPFVNGIQYEFEIYGRTSAGEVDPGKVHLMWRNKISFKADARPEGESGNCYLTNGICNFMHPCTGLRNVGSNFSPVFERVGPCTCCTCWYDVYSSRLLLNDQQASVNGRYPEIMIDRFPMNGWYMMYKMRIEPSIQSLSPRAYRFWKAVRDQYSAATNIFQPIAGKIPGNIVQTAGPDSAPSGIFYSTSISSKYFYIERKDVNVELIPDARSFKSGATPCFNLFPNSSPTPPSYWVE